MTEQNFPEVEKELTSDVVEESEETVNYGEKSIHELITCFENLLNDPDKMKKSKEVDAIKATFYKKLNKEKEDFSASNPGVELSNENPLFILEDQFKSLYNKYKRERSEYNKNLELEKENNLQLKEQLIEQLKSLIDSQEDTGKDFQELRSIQEKWRSIGHVPENKFKNINDTYNLYIEHFYDKVKLNKEMRDLDFKKNLEFKEDLCNKAEKLLENDNIIESFNLLQKLHDNWKEIGPVAKEHREAIWERFKQTTSIINKKYQEFYEGLKEQYKKNLAAKEELCKKIEDIIQNIEIKTVNDWNSYAKQIEEIQKEWKQIGFATKKENQKIYDRFRKSCDDFYTKKREYYNDFKDSMNHNLEQKLELIKKSAELKLSNDWKATTEKIIELQKQWKEIGAVPRKKSEQLWKEFRVNCDEFFANKEKNSNPENNFYGNLKAKKALIENIKSYQCVNEDEDAKAMQEFINQWNNIGFVPFKEKENIQKEYKLALKEKFPNYGKTNKFKGGKGSQLSERDICIQKYNKLQQEITNYENNIGFFANSKNSQILVDQMKEKIQESKNKLEELKAKIQELS